MAWRVVRLVIYLFLSCQRYGVLLLTISSKAYHPRITYLWAVAIHVCRALAAKRLVIVMPSRSKSQLATCNSKAIARPSRPTVECSFISLRDLNHHAMLSCAWPCSLAHCRRHLGKIPTTAVQFHKSVHCLICICICICIYIEQWPHLPPR